MEWKSADKHLRPFWTRGSLWLLLAAASALPFFFVKALPLVDLPNHLGRFYIFLNWNRSEFLQQFYSVHWSLIGNLGVDLLVRALGPLLGVELATRLVVASIPPLTIAGIYAVSRAVNGVVTPAALLSVSLAYNWPLLMGFVNFSLSAAMALLVLALWVRLRQWSFTARLLLFAPLAFATWVAHTAGWGMLGLAVAAYEVARLRGHPFSVGRLAGAALQTLPFAIPILFIVMWRSATSTGVGLAVDDSIVVSKAISAASLFRERYIAWDALSSALYVGLAAWFYVRGGRRLVPETALICCAMTAAFILSPQELFSSAFADRRLLPYAGILLPLAIGLAPESLTQWNRRRELGLMAAIALAFFAVRVSVTCYAFHSASRLKEDQLAMLNAIPVHSRIFGLAVESCGKRWSPLDRPEHIQQYALLRRDSMINGTFQNSGLNQVKALYARDEGFNPNMLAVVHEADCPVPYIKETLQTAMQRFPRELFDYVWLIREQPSGTYDTTSLRQIMAIGDDRLYQVEHER